jgi:hypothetical protein
VGLQSIVSTRLDLNIALEDGEDRIQGSRLYIGRNQTISGGRGHDQITLVGGSSTERFVLGTSSASVATFLGEDGADSIMLTYSFIGGRLVVDGGADKDKIDVRMSAANGDVSFNGGSGADSLICDTNYFVASLFMGGGGDADLLELRNSLGIVAATLDGGAGNDTAAVSNLTAGRLALTTGSQSDILDVRSSMLDALFADLGPQDDRLTLYGNLVRGQTNLDGGAGGDAFFDLGNGFLGGIRRLAFEG